MSLSFVFSFDFERNCFYNLNIETTKGCERHKIYHESWRQGFARRPLSPVLLSYIQIQEIVHVIKAAQLELIDVVETKCCQGIVSCMARPGLGGFKNADFQGEYWKNISIVPVSWPHVAPPKMQIYDFRIME